MNENFNNGSFHDDGTYNPEYTSGSRKQDFPWAKVIALMLVAALLGGALGAGGMLLLSPSGSNRSSQILEGTRPNSSIDVATIDTSREMTPAEVYAQNVASTVGITTSVTTNFFGFTTTSAASGSGFVFSDDGYILTNYHVVENSTAIKVTMYDGSSYDAELIGYDESTAMSLLSS